MKMTRLAWILIAILAFILIQVVIFTAPAWAEEPTTAEEYAAIVGGTESQSVARPLTFQGTVTSVGSLTCWRGNVLGKSDSPLGPRARWETGAEWCGNGKIVKRVDSKWCRDRGGGIFTFDKVVECSRSAVGYPNVHIVAKLRYTRTVWVPFPVEIVRFANVSLWLGPKGGMSGSQWWSS